MFAGRSDSGGGSSAPVGASVPNPSVPGTVKNPAHEEITVTASRLPLELSSAAPAVPLRWAFRPTFLSSRALMMLGASAGITALLAAPAEVSGTDDLLNDSGEPNYLYHFTNDTGKRGISGMGVVMPGASGFVYFSPLPYASPAQAQSALALPRTPTGYFMIPRANVPGPLNWNVVAPNFGQPGGGLEAAHQGTVPLTGASWVQFGP
jgi:hypothetical protein